MTGMNIHMNVSGNKGKSNENELIEVQRKFIDFWGNKVKFLPVDTPEKFLAELDNDKQFLGLIQEDKSGKKYFSKKTEASLGIEDITSEDIFAEQKRVVSKINEESDFYKNILAILEGLF